MGILLPWQTFQFSIQHPGISHMFHVCDWIMLSDHISYFVYWFHSLNVLSKWWLLNSSYLWLVWCKSPQTLLFLGYSLACFKSIWFEIGLCLSSLYFPLGTNIQNISFHSTKRVGSYLIPLEQWKLSLNLSLASLLACFRLSILCILKWTVLY